MISYLVFLSYVVLAVDSESKSLYLFPCFTCSRLANPHLCWRLLTSTTLSFEASESASAKYIPVRSHSRSGVPHARDESESQEGPSHPRVLATAKPSPKIRMRQVVGYSFRTEKNTLSELNAVNIPRPFFTFVCGSLRLRESCCRDA